jgi:Skp family chaperone for outer membrane proteins
MKRRIVVLCGLLLFAPAASATDNQDGSPPAIGVVDIAQVFERYQMTRDLEERFDARQRAIRDEADNRRKAMENQFASLEAFDPASKDYAERRDGLRQMEFEFRVWLEMEEQRLKDEHMLWLRLIYDDVSEAVAQAARSRDIDLVLTYRDLSLDVPDSAALRNEILLKKVLYFTDRVDLTGQVLRLANESYERRGGRASLREPPPMPTVTPEPPAQPPPG